MFSGYLAATTRIFTGAWLGFALLAWGLVLYPAGQALAGEGDPVGRIVFSTPVIEEADGFRFYQLLYTEAFGRLGYDFELHSHPVKRSMASANQGVTDGDTGRIEKLITSGEYPNLLLVPVVIGQADVAIFTRDGTETFTSWDDLDKFRGTDVVIAHTRGFVAVELELHKHVDASNIFITSKGVQDCMMLAAGRIDYFIEPKAVIEQFIQEGLCDGDGVKLAGIVETVLVYPVLNKKHADLAPKLAKVIRDIQDEGLFDEFLKRSQEEPDPSPPLQ